MHHRAAPHVAQDLVVDVLVESHHGANAEIGVIEDCERPESGIGIGSEDKARPHTPDSEWPLREAAAAFCA